MNSAYCETGVTFLGIMIIEIMQAGQIFCRIYVARVLVKNLAKMTSSLP